MPRYFGALREPPKVRRNFQPTEIVQDNVLGTDSLTITRHESTEVSVQGSVSCGKTCAA
jgi:hypothetical protein